MRRRVVYIEDATWERLRELASERSLTMSAVIRDLLTPAPILSEPDAIMAEMRDPAFVQFRPVPKPTRK